MTSGESVTPPDRENLPANLRYPDCSKCGCWPAVIQVQRRDGSQYPVCSKCLVVPSRPEAQVPS
jgi:hypothetical protein